MNDEYVSKLAIWSTITWAAVAALNVAAWMTVLIADQWPIGGMLAATGCALSALAAVLSIRRYAVRICRLIRSLHGVDGDGREELHAVR